jgi:hypothetical protein
MNFELLHFGPLFHLSNTLFVQGVDSVVAFFKSVLTPILAIFGNRELDEFSFKLRNSSDFSCADFV